MVALQYPVLWSKLAVVALAVSTVGLLFVQPSHAEMVMGIELSPAVCRMHPNYAMLRQCAEGKPANVSYFSTGTQGRCSSQIKLALPPLQEKVITRVIADPYIRQQLWQNYGVCSGTSASDYFRQITTYFNALKMPEEMLASGRFRVSHGSFLRELNRANPTLFPQSVRLFCQASTNHLPTLTQINICYSNAGSYAKCTRVRPSNCPSIFYIEGK